MPQRSTRLVRRLGAEGIAIQVSLRDFFGAVAREAGAQGDLPVNGAHRGHTKRGRLSARALISARPVIVLVPILIALGAQFGASSRCRAESFMPTGDSITEGVGSTSGLGFRHLLYTSLNTSGTYDFVGPTGAPPDEGDFYTGARIGDFLAGGAHDIAPTISNFAPDLVAVHLGSNDIYLQPGPFGPWSANHSTPSANASGRLGALIQQILAAGRRVVVSRIIPIAGREDDVEVFNREVVRAVLDYRNGAVTGSVEPVYLADHYLRFLASPTASEEWMFDQLHPNDAGYDEMEAVYREAVQESMTDVVPPDPVTDLAIGTVNGQSVLLIWTNTGDDGSAGDPRYADSRFSLSPITTTGFKTLGQGGDYRMVGRGGEIGGARVEGLTPASVYHFAMKLTDEVPNLSAMSNQVSVATTASANTFADSFTRTMSAPGPDWAALDYVVNGSELERTGAGFGTAIFTAVTSPATAEITWGAGADAAGINQAGVACRLEGLDPATVDGYIVYRNTAGDQRLVLRELVDGAPATLVDTAPSTRPAPQAGDRFAVTVSSDSEGHRFAVYVNGALDGVLFDPLRRRGNGDYWAGVVCAGSYNNNVADWRLEAVSTNAAPLAFSLLAPANATLLPNLNPLLDWQSTTDPNGEQVTYDVFLSPDPTFPPGTTLRADNLAASNYATGTPLAPNTTYYWRVRAQDPVGASTYSSVWTLSTANLQQIGDDFERPALGPDWVADPSYRLVNGELDGQAAGFSDLAVYTHVQNPVAVEWRWSETASTPGIGFGGCLLGLNASATNASGYFVFRNTGGAQRWSVWEVVNGELGSSLGIDVAGANPIPQPGDVVRVVFVRTASAHHFECYVNDRFDARLTDANRRQGTAAVTYAGLLLGEDAANNVEDFVILGANLNLPPAAFNLVTPTDQSIVYSLAPELRWEPAADPNPGDPVSYTVLYDTDPNFGNPVTLPPTLATSTVIHTALPPGQAYHWRVRAADPSGGAVNSRQTWTFATAPVQIATDNFNRAALGPDWAGDLAAMQIVGNELRNIAPTTSFDLAIYAARANPNAASFRWGPATNPDGIARGGLALMLDAASGSASGYWVTIDPFLNQSKLAEIRSGANVGLLANASGETNAPGAGDTWRVLLSSDPTGHHFDVYVGDDFHSRLTDPIKRQGNVSTRYAGVALRGQAQNPVDDFSITLPFGPAPGPFLLSTPTHADTGVVYQPTFTWHAAGPIGVAYVVYVGTDSTMAASDSLVALADTTLTWPVPLAHATSYVWRVRATDGQSSVLNSRGWYRFRTTDTPAAVELAGFTARGDVGAIILSWVARQEIDHLGYHVWRAEEEGEYRRLTGPELLTGESPYSFTDRTAVAGRTYRYRLEAVSRSGESEFFGPITGVALATPAVLALHPNVPNPFNPATALTFDLPERTAVRLVVFDLAGRTVRELTAGTYPAGRHTVTWDGRAGSGSPASSGIYFARLTVGDWSSTRKLILMK